MSDTTAADPDTATGSSRTGGKISSACELLEDYITGKCRLQVLFSNIRHKISKNFYFVIFNR